jgi:hypothetical protein
MPCWMAERYGFSIYDAMIVASALDAGCDTLWSEDMQHRMVLDEGLRIVDPFARDVIKCTVTVIRAVTVIPLALVLSDRDSASTRFGKRDGILPGGEAKLPSSVMNGGPHGLSDIAFSCCHCRLRELAAQTRHILREANP